MADKPVSITPARAAAAAQAAGVSATCVLYDHVSSGDYEDWYYRLRAPTIPGWTFVRFQWRRYQTIDGQEMASRGYSETSNPAPPDNEGRDWPGASVICDDTHDMGYQVSGHIIKEIEAVYEAPYTPTHLLVNSATVGNPVQLVYDDRAGGTGRLVADY